VTTRSKLRLGVDIHHVATFRNARGGREPDPVHAAEIAIAAAVTRMRAAMDRGRARTEPTA